MNRLHEQLNPFRLGQLLEAICHRSLLAGWALNYPASLCFRQYREMNRRFELTRAAVDQRCFRHQCERHTNSAMTPKLMCPRSVFNDYGLMSLFD